MNKTLIETKTVMNERGQNYQFSYARIEEESGYGVSVESQEAAAAVRSITSDRKRIDALLAVLCRCTVSPTQLRDVVEDWLAEH